MLMIFVSACALQRPDRGYNVSVVQPTYKNKRPKILYDEAHLNTHRAHHTYQALIDLYQNDGCAVSINRQAFTEVALTGYDLLIICNAKSDKTLPRDIGAFSEAECQKIRNWVKNGGGLLLIADHHPFGLANQGLALLFGVQMGGGRVLDHTNPGRKQNSQLEFSRQNGLLADHPITNGTSLDEKIDRILTFSGQSLKIIGDDAQSLLTFGRNATEVRPDSLWEVDDTHYVRFGKPVSVAQLSQAAALEFGQGKVVILGEAAMLSAQKLFFKKFGMNDPSYPDNRQFALNIAHWLLD